MSDLRPRGVPVTVEGVERHFLFTLNAIDEIQDHYGKPLSETIQELADDTKSVRIMRYLIAVLLNDEAERERAAGKGELKTYTEQEAGWLAEKNEMVKYTMAILTAYGVSLPEAEDEDPNQTGGQQS